MTTLRPTVMLDDPGMDVFDALWGHADMTDDDAMALAIEAQQAARRAER